MEIENFVGLFKNGFHIKAFTKSAFVQYRKKINPEVFRHLSDVIVKEFYTDNDSGIKLWKGFRLLAVDGSRLTLPHTEELKKNYGETRNQNQSGVVQSRVSVLYDVINNYVIDGMLSPLSIGEGKLALKHLSYANKNDLILYDRGYPSFELIYEHNKLGINFLIRVKEDFSQKTKEFIKSGRLTQFVDIYPGQHKKIVDKDYDSKTMVTVRLVRVELPDGEVELLITSLIDINKYPTMLFKELYFKRWGIETFYDEFKNKIKVENFSGYSNQSIMQDFYAALFVSNVQTLIISEIVNEIDEQTKGNKYKYKVNANLSYGFLKNRIVALFFSNNDMDKTIEELKLLFKKHLVPIRPERSFERHKDKYRRRMKPKVTKNQRDAI
jgi:hypothetical protein